MLPKKRDAKKFCRIRVRAPHLYLTPCQDSKTTTGEPQDRQLNTYTPSIYLSRCTHMAFDTKSNSQTKLSLTSFNIPAFAHRLGVQAWPNLSLHNHTLYTRWARRKVTRDWLKGKTSWCILFAGDRRFLWTMAVYYLSDVCHCVGFDGVSYHQIPVGGCCFPFSFGL